MIRGLVVSLVALAAFLDAAQPARATEKIAVNASNVAIKVDAKGHAVVYYTRGGRRYHPVVWGAINARPPSRSVPQVKFKVDFSGGYKRLGYPLWRTIRNRCRPYDGPRLPWFVTGCRAPDGSYWALQRFQRLLPNLGIAPFRAYQNDWELHLSHWKGEIPRLEAYADWVYSKRFHEVFGRLTYRGNPVHGFSATSAGVPLDSYGRLLYLDTYNSAYGPGWKRENSFLFHRPGGNYCYGFYPRERFSWYPPGPARPPGNGERYRLTAGGPGVTPMVARIIDGLPAYDPNNAAHVQLEAEMNPLKDQLSPGDDCKNP